MADERIEVKVWKNPFTCEDCEFGPRPKCGFQTPCLPADYLPTRQEVIERMAKAMCENDTGVKWEKNGVVYQHIYKDLAEAALDALLSALDKLGKVN